MIREHDLPASLRPWASRLEAPQPEEPCIYFLIEGSCLNYVGQTTSLSTRLQDHRRRIPFDRVVLLPCREEDLNRTESSFIKELVPPYNLDQRGQPYGRSRNSDLIVLVRLAGAQRRKFIAAARKKGVGMSRFAREILMWYVGHLVGEDDGKFWIF